MLALFESNIINFIKMEIQWTCEILNITCGLSVYKHAHNKSLANLLKSNDPTKVRNELQTLRCVPRSLPIRDSEYI